MISWILKHIKSLLEHKAIYLALTLTILNTIASLIPLDLNTVKHEDKYLHIVAYTFLTLSWLFATQYKKKKYSTQLMVFTTIILYGGIIEILQQQLTTYRTGDLLDLFADIVGLIIAAIIFVPFSRYIKSIKN